MRLIPKTTALLVLSMAACLAVEGWLTIRRTTAFLEADVRADETQLAQPFAEAVALVWRQVGPGVARSLIDHADAVSGDMDIRWVAIDSLGAILPDPLDDQLRAGEQVSTVERGGDRLVTYVPIRVGDAPTGAIEVAQQLTRERAYIHANVVRRVATVVVLALVCGILAAMIGAWFVRRPVRRMIALTRAIGEGRPAPRIAPTGRDELAELGRELDAMCDRLADADERARQQTAARIAAIEQLRHADRLTTAGTLAAGLAHELGTPLNVVSGRAAMIRSGTLDRAGVAECARIIGEQVTRMTAFVRQFLAFARRRESVKVATDLSALVRQTIALITPVARRHDVTVTLADGATPMIASVDPSQLEQVLTNLLMNAIQDMPTGGPIGVRIDRTAATPPPDVTTTASTWYVIRVIDAGHGIPPANLTRIFEPFFTTKEVGTGTGLGLSVAYGIVRDHGGWIGVDSAIGRGTTFSVYLPAS